MIPTVMLYASSLYTPWTVYGSDVSVALTARAEAVRNPYEETLYANSHEGLSLPADTYYLYPGPEMANCPIAVGRVIGQEMTMSTHPTMPHEQEGLIYRLAGTFSTTILRNDAMWRVSMS
jgi:hypothetical protein